MSNSFKLNFSTYNGHILQIFILTLVVFIFKKREEIKEINEVILFFEMSKNLNSHHLN